MMFLHNSLFYYFDIYFDMVHVYKFVINKSINNLINIYQVNILILEVIKDDFVIQNNSVCYYSIIKETGHLFQCLLLIIQYIIW